MAFDFNNCKLVGPVNDRFGAAGLMIPPKVVDCPAREVLALADKWNWPEKLRHIPKPWEKEAKIHEAVRKAITRFSLEAKISSKGKYQKTETTAYWRTNHWVPDVDFPDEFYGFTEVPWTNVYERSITVDDDVRMEFIEPDPDALADIREKGASVDAGRVCEAWKDRTEDIRRCACKNDPRYRLLRECVRIFTFGSIVRIGYSCRGAECVVWFNLGNRQVHVEKGERGTVTSAGPTAQKFGTILDYLRGRR